MDEYTDAHSGEYGKLRDGMGYAQGGRVCPADVKAGVGAQVNQHHAGCCVKTDGLGQDDADGNQGNCWIGEYAAGASDGHEQHQDKGDHVIVGVFSAARDALKGHFNGACLLKQMDGGSDEHDHDEKDGGILKAGNRGS